MSRVSDALRKVNPEEPWRRIAPSAVTEDTIDSMIEGIGPFGRPEPLASPAILVDRSAPPQPERPAEQVPAPTFNGFTFDNLLTSHLVIAPEIEASAVEQYRKLATVLHQAQIERNIKVIMVAGAVSAEGKTLTATNLALTLSGSFRRTVLLIEADLRRPALRNVFNAPTMPGLSDALAADSDRQLQVLQPSPYLSVLLGGRPDSDPVTGLSSDRMRHILEDAAARFDWVIIDTPPAAQLPDVKLLSPSVDGALLVVRAGVTPCTAIQRAIEALGKDRILGVVLNAAQLVDVHGYGYEAYTYSPSASPASPMGLSR